MPPTVDLPVLETSPALLADDEELRRALRCFVHEDRRRSHGESWLTVVLFVASVGTALRPSVPWGLRITASLLEGLVLVRGFVLFHDAMHGAIFRGSAAARALFSLVGALLLTPPRVWRETHDYHHAHTAQIVGSHIGSYPLVTVTMWQRMSRRQRASYRFARHPLTILLAYLTVFAFGMCAVPFVRAPRKHLAAGAILLLHLGAWVGALAAHVFLSFVLGYLAPLSFACALGAYLFYAQHNFVGVEITSREHWSSSQAALRASSYFAMGPVMRFFSANIGFHHVHHLHAGIPFYRLPEAVRELPALRHASRTSFHPRDVLGCLRLKLWDSATRTMIGYPPANTAAARDV